MPRSTNLVAGLALFIACLAGSDVFAQTAPPDDQSASLAPEGFTLPSQEARITAPTQALVDEVPVKEGDRVTAGQVLLVQDRSVEQKLLELYQTEAESAIRVEAAMADRDVKQAEFGRVEKLYQENGSTQSEFERARLEWVLGEKQVGAAELEHKKNALEADHQRLKIERMEIRSPFDGYVERLEVAKGEVTDPQRPVIHLVRNDPLKIEVHLPPQDAARLRIGQSVQVRYRDLDDPTWHPAEVSFLSPVVDTQSNQRRVNLTMSNPEGREAGLWVLVKLPEQTQPTAQSQGPEYSGAAAASR
jgi:RND family efflux transporter MFP subunit